MCEVLRAEPGLKEYIKCHHVILRKRNVCVILDWSPSIAVSLSFKVEIKGSTKAFRRNRTGCNLEGNGERLGIGALESDHLGYIQRCHLDVHLLFSKHAQGRSCSEHLTCISSFGSHSNLTRWVFLLFIPFTDEKTEAQRGYNLLNPSKEPEVCWHLCSLAPLEKWGYKWWYLPHSGCQLETTVMSLASSI